MSASRARAGESSRRAGRFSSAMIDRFAQLSLQGKVKSNDEAGLQALPTEVREMIWEYLFAPAACKTGNWRHFYSFPLEVLRLNRAMGSQALKTFHRVNQLVVVRFHGWGDVERICAMANVPIICLDEEIIGRLLTAGRCRMEVTMEGGAADKDLPPVCLLTLADDLPVLCEQVRWTLFRGTRIMTEWRLDEKGDDILRTQPGHSARQHSITIYLHAHGLQSLTPKSEVALLGKLSFLTTVGQTVEIDGSVQGRLEVFLFENKLAPTSVSMTALAWWFYDMVRNQANLVAELHRRGEDELVGMHVLRIVGTFRSSVLSISTNGHRKTELSKAMAAIQIILIDCLLMAYGASTRASQYKVGLDFLLNEAMHVHWENLRQMPLLRNLRLLVEMDQTPIHLELERYVTVSSVQSVMATNRMTSQLLDQFIARLEKFKGVAPNHVPIAQDLNVLLMTRDNQPRIDFSNPWAALMFYERLSISYTSIVPRTEGVYSLEPPDWVDGWVAK